MIEWIEYDSTSRDIESHVAHLVTDGMNVWTALHAKLLIDSGYGWTHLDTRLMYRPVTHWAKINLPWEESK